MIVSLDGTTLNGGRVPLWFDGIKFAHDVRLLGGNDFLYVSGLTGTAGLFIDTGHDNDGVSLEHVNLDGAIVNTGTGNDTVSVGGGKFNWTSFNLGVGDDRLNVFGTSFNGVAFNGGQGNDSLAVMAVKWNEFPLTTAFESVFGSLMPVANNDRFNVGRGESVTLNILANDRAILGILDPIDRDRSPGNPNTVRSRSTTTAPSPTPPPRAWPRRATASVTPFAAAPGPSRTKPRSRSSSRWYRTRPGRSRRSRRPRADSTNVTPIPFRITFNENVVGFDGGRHHGPEWERVGLRGRSGQPALVHLHRHTHRPGRGHGQRRRRRGRGQQGQRQLGGVEDRDLRYHAADRDHRLR